MDIKKLRLKKGLTQKQLAELVGKDRTVINKIENGKIKPTIGTAKALGKILKVKWVYFFED